YPASDSPSPATLPLSIRITRLPDIHDIYMLTKLRYLHIAVICAAMLCMLPGGGCQRADRADGRSAALRDLDRLLESPDTFTQSRRYRITYLSERLRHVDAPADRYNIYRGLYGQYRRYRCDSAMLTAETRLRTARTLGGQPLISASLNLAESYSEMGNYHEALEILDTIPRNGLADYHLQYLYDIYGRTFRRLADRDAIGDHKLAYAAKAAAYRDSTLQLLADTMPDYFYIRASQLTDAGKWDKAMATLDRMEERFGADDTPAHLAIKADICRHLNRRGTEVEYLARAAATDLRAGHKDSEYLTRLAITLNEMGDVERAYRYITRALADVRFSEANAASSDVLEAMPIIEQAHHEAERRRTLYISILSGIILLLALVLGVALRVAHRRLAANRRLSATLEENNRRLARVNRALASANQERTAYIYDIFSAHSDYIERIAAFRRTLSRLLTVRKYGEAAEILKDEQIESSALQDMYARFDTVFLNICPDFIEVYNTMVGPSDRLDPASRSLTAPLRMLALMKLGVTSTRRLAEMLHYNTQTIYNYRARLKGALTADREVWDAWISAPIPDACISAAAPDEDDG
ncbi:MAG: hypothetical protein K2H21_07255, partial [Muribaculaceae bacterium]|nr:hypothetical protein [Muribaculaceae bacterium]